ncbi:M48 family metalloprotease [Streptomyces sp. Amel2xC10]|uniref:M48 family metalloprotease n=1 Tax=Streptomyces sp. Amel2xC10 TaxID=1305826 RepID=UPI000A08D079|nr:M48 family metalloprotease [Streptomyces sp. Amel2xC10]SMF71029.1 Zn-dependent protease with chaperone function [Streptomyces sp. Amel2xC10]
MGLFVFLPLVLPLTAWPVARLAEQRLHPRTATRLLTGVAAVMAVCSTVCLGLLMVVGTAQLPGNPLPDAWSDPEVRAAVPHDEIAGRAAVPTLCVVAVVCARTLWRHHRVRRRAHRALTGLPDTQVAVLPDAGAAYAYALPGGRHGSSGGYGRIVVTSALLDCLEPAERRALFAHERAHLAARHHRHLLAVRLAAQANPFLWPLRTAVAYTAERWADEEAARAVGSRRTVARAIGKAALVSHGAAPLPGLAALVPPGAAPLPGLAALVPPDAAPPPGLAALVPPDAAPPPGLAALAGLPAFAAPAPGPVPRRVTALLDPAPTPRHWASVFTTVGLAVWCAAAGTAVSAMSSANAAVTMLVILHAATPL